VPDESIEFEWSVDLDVGTPSLAAMLPGEVREQSFLPEGFIQPPARRPGSARREAGNPSLIRVFLKLHLERGARAGLPSPVEIFGVSYPVASFLDLGPDRTNALVGLVEREFPDPMKIPCSGERGSAYAVPAEHEHGPVLGPGGFHRIGELVQVGDERLVFGIIVDRNVRGRRHVRRRFVQDAEPWPRES